MNSLRHGALLGDSAWLIDLTIFFVIGIPLILMAILIWEATRDE
jgi:hypothetical protein